jgi:hypothetical protein
MQSVGPLVDLIKMKQVVEDTYVAMKNGKKVNIYPTTNYPFLTTNPDNPNENNLDFIPSCP